MTNGQGYGPLDEPWPPRYDPRDHGQQLRGPQGQPPWEQAGYSHQPYPRQPQYPQGQSWPQQGYQPPQGPPPGPPPGWQPGYGQQPPWGPPPGPPQPPQHRKKHTARNVYIGIGALVVIIIAISVAAASGSRTGNTTGSGTGTAAVASCKAYHAITSREWLEIAKNPDASKGECIIVYGEISQFDSATGDNAFRATAGGVKIAPEYGFADYPTNALFDGSPAMLGSFVEGDLFTARVTVDGHLTYDNTVGGQTTVPVMQVDSITRTGHLSS